jgi:hypothetical protein
MMFKVNRDSDANTTSQQLVPLYSWALPELELDREIQQKLDMVKS